jgi:GMP synthase (glutamine-hydrolysing)
VVLAHTGDGELQVVRYAANAWGVQLHPEVDETIVGTWVTDSERGELADRGLDADKLLEEIRLARTELDQAWAPLAAGFADVALGPPT